MSDKYLTVTAVTKYVKRKFETDPHLRNIWLRGEISNFKLHSRGHMYLTIKDENSRIQAVMFAGNNRSLKFTPENGMNVLIKGEISVFEPYGQYQLYIQQMEPDGIGSLYLAYEQLKEKLQKQGYFDESRKKDLPAFPNHIGVITSPTGAAVRDIITTIRRRYPIVKVTVLPVLVQGENAARSIRNAIEAANEQSYFDCLIVGRGGGSIEELWSFNEEIVAQAIYYSKIPIISAVGHETDFTISDYVADLRAPTPTGAAELAVPSQAEITGNLFKLKRSMTNMLMGHLANSNKRLTRLQNSYAFRYPEHLLKQKEQELDKGTERLERTIKILASGKHDSVTNLHKRLSNYHPARQVNQLEKELLRLTRQNTNQMKMVMQQHMHGFTQVVEKLALLNPLETIKRGYAIPYTNDGKVLNSALAVKKDSQINVKLRDGTIDCQVISVKEEMIDDAK